MHKPPLPSLEDYLWHHAPLVLMHLNGGGEILDLNAFARRSIAGASEGIAFREILVDFTDAFDLAEALSAPDESRLLNVASSQGAVASYHFRFFASEGGCTVVGAPDVEGLEGLRVKVLELNRDLNEQGRALQKANAELKSLNALKNQFLGMAAHDLRKPAGIIVSYAEFLREEAGSAGFTDEQTGFIDTIIEGAVRMRRLIDDFLDVSLIESGQLTLDRTPTKLSTFVERSSAMIRIYAQKKGIHLRIERTDGDEVLDIDSSKFEQVFINLLGNAVEHSEPGTEVLFQVGIQGNNAVFEVRDQGVGIPADKQKQLFQAFERAGTRKTAGERSTGLGLAIAKKIVEAHGGRISVESAPGQGSVFTVSIPQRKMS